VAVDLTDLQSVYRAAASIKGQTSGLLYHQDDTGSHVTLPRLDVLILNAGMAGFDGIRWGPAIWDCLTNTREAVTWWEHSIVAPGRTAAKQRAYEGENKAALAGDSAAQQPEREQPALGQVFCANVFGHYILAHELMASLHATGSGRAAGEAGRIIWTSSIEALDGSFSIDDLQGLATPESYRSSKRLTDLLVLTADLPSVRHVAASWFADASSPAGASSPAAAADAAATAARPKLYLAHPGICQTGIVPLARVLRWCMLLALYVARLLGSVWHPIAAYKGAVAATWLALAPDAQLDGLEARRGRAKWGASTSLWGGERVRRTWVPGWGLGGRLEAGDGRPVAGLKRGTPPLTPGALEDFERLGGAVWRDMERLRLQWEVIVRGADVRG
jgi:3-keto steroid reductase